MAVGTTFSATFPTTPNAYQRTRRGTDIWLAKFAPDLSALLASTFFGGGVSEFASGVALDADGRAVITGFTTSADFPLVEPLPLSPPFGSGGSRDYILSILSPDLSQLLHSSKFGNAGWELGGEVAIGRDGFIYAIGRTRTGEQEAGASQDIFVLKGEAVTACDGKWFAAPYDSLSAVQPSDGYRRMPSGARRSAGTEETGRRGANARSAHAPESVSDATADGLARILARPRRHLHGGPMDSRGPRLSHQTKPLQVCPCDDGWRCAQHFEPWPHDDCAGPRSGSGCQPEAYSPSDVR